MISPPINHAISHLYQGDETYCWAASLAMLRREPTVDGMIQAARRQMAMDRGLARRLAMARRVP